MEESVDIKDFISGEVIDLLYEETMQSLKICITYNRNVKTEALILVNEILGFLLFLKPQTPAEHSAPIC